MPELGLQKLKSTFASRVPNMRKVSTLSVKFAWHEDSSLFTILKLVALLCGRLGITGSFFCTQECFKAGCMFDPSYAAVIAYSYSNQG